MTNALLTAILLVFLLQFAVLCFVFSRTHVLFREFLSFISPKAEGQASPAAELWAAMSKTLVQEFKMTLLGLLSVQSKAEKRVESELFDQALSEKNPNIALALSAFPALKKVLVRNPALIEFALKKVASIGAQGVAPVQGDYASLLKKYG